jgi:hypothetical protein
MEGYFDSRIFFWKCRSPYSTTRSKSNNIGSLRSAKFWLIGQQSLHRNSLSTGIMIQSHQMSDRQRREGLEAALPFDSVYPSSPTSSVILKRKLVKNPIKLLFNAGDHIRLPPTETFMGNFALSNAEIVHVNPAADHSFLPSLFEEYIVNSLVQVNLALLFESFP